MRTRAVPPRLVGVPVIVVAVLAPSIRALAGEPSLVELPGFFRGDANSDQDVDLGDAIFVLGYAFLGGREPACADAADANDDGDIDVGDAIFILSYSFLGGAPPPAPGPRSCGDDPTLDGLPPCEEPACEVVVSTVLVADVDGDGDDETVETDPEAPLGRSTLEDDTVRVGTADGRVVRGRGNVDGDPEDDEIIVEDPERTRGEVEEIDLDGDGDPDIVAVGTGGDAEYEETADADGDPSEEEIILVHPKRSWRQTIYLDTDGDGDPDVIIVGTEGGLVYRGPSDEDGDGDQEIVLEDPEVASGVRTEIDTDGDGDTDIVVIGTRP